MFLYYYKFIEIVKKLCYHIISILLILMTLLLFFAVLSRYIFSYSFSWIDAFSRYSMVYISFIGGAIALHEGSHIGINYFLNLLSCNIRKIIKKIHFLLIIFVGIIMYTSTTGLISKGYNTAIPALLPLVISRGHIYHIFPITAFLYILFTSDLLLYEKKEKKSKSF